ncbi:heme peroxidase [Xylariales sp. PMI_506]|nr:heme peroxidase [Xylariales sp. PMI_506]
MASPIGASILYCAAASRGPHSTPNPHYGEAQDRQSTCPSVWTEVAADLKTIFLDQNGHPTDDARAAVRTTFHDCWPGSCDGSLILANECETRVENQQMVPICGTLRTIAAQYSVGVADLIQLATALGVAVSYGPAMSFKVGRTDSNTPNPPNQIPTPTSAAEALVANFAARGFSPYELVALVGSHSAGKALDGTPLDTTVEVLDTAFYGETQNGSAPISVPADVNLSHSSETSSIWTSFSTGSLATWQAAFVPAMEKLGLLGNDEASLIDCSSVITNTIPTRRGIYAPSTRRSRAAH